MQKITPFLWFEGNAEEAAKFYVSVFKKSKVLGMTRFGDAGPGPKGHVLTVKFRLDGQEFTGLNGGPQFKFTEAVSFAVECKTQQEVDRLWNRLTEKGGAPSQCGWLKDRFGLSWQIVPDILPKLLASKDRKKADRVMQAMMQMTKIDIAGLQRA